jgi:hypothetical protein
VVKAIADSVKPVRFGVLIGLFGLVFGIGWAFYLMLGHERIHRSLEQRASMAAPQKTAHQESPSAQKIREPAVNGHTHKDGGLHRHAEAASVTRPETYEEAGLGFDKPPAGAGHGPAHEEAGHGHDSPVMKDAHTKLVRGHLHAMGLGIATVLISMVIAFTSAGQKVKTAITVLTGLGGIIYPLAWIVMGFRTPELGPEAAEASVIFIAGPGVALVSLGVFSAIGFIFKDIFKGG